MKKIQLTIVCLLIATATMFAQSNGTTPAAPQKVVYPNLRDAKERLNEAKKFLQTASDDFGGHKLKAIESIEASLREINAAIEWNQTHPAK